MNHDFINLSETKSKLILADAETISRKISYSESLYFLGSMEYML